MESGGHNIPQAKLYKSAILNGISHPKSMVFSSLDLASFPGLIPEKIREPGDEATLDLHVYPIISKTYVQNTNLVYVLISDKPLSEKI